MILITIILLLLILAIVPALLIMGGVVAVMYLDLIACLIILICVKKYVFYKLNKHKEKSLR